MTRHRKEYRIIAGRPGNRDEVLSEFARVNAEVASVLEALKQELATALRDGQ